MSITDLKAKIIHQVNEIEDEHILQEIYALVRCEARVSTLYHLTEQEMAAVEDGLQDIRDGHIFSSEQANQLMREWLKK